MGNFKNFNQNVYLITHQPFSTTSTSQRILNNLIINVLSVFLWILRAYLSSFQQFSLIAVAGAVVSMEHIRTPKVVSCLA